MVPTTPRGALLFSGHIVDASARETPRFPPAMEAVARQAIAHRLDAIGVGSGDLAVCGGACGGDLIFAKTALARDVALEVYLTFDVGTFVQRSVEFAGGDWRTLRRRAGFQRAAPDAR